MARQIYLVKRTENEETSIAGAATYNPAKSPDKIKSFESIDDVDVDDLKENEVIEVDTETSGIATTNKIQKDNLNPVTSDAVYNALSYVEDESDAGFDWFGKRVYKKVLVANEGGSISLQTGLDATIVDQIVKFESVVQGNTQNGSVQGWSPLTPIMSSSASGTANFYRAWLSNDYTTFTVGIQGSGLGTQNPSYWHVIIYYTKKDA